MKIKIVPHTLILFLYLKTDFTNGMDLGFEKRTGRSCVLNHSVSEITVLR